MSENGPRIAFTAGRFHTQTNARTINKKAFRAVFSAHSLETRIDAAFIGYIDLCEDSANLLGDFCAAIFIHIKDADLDAFGGESTGCCFAQSGRPARNDGCDFIG